MTMYKRSFAVVFTAMVALQAPQSATSAPNDVSNGSCDNMKGQQRSLCVRAYAAANQVERLMEKGSTVAQLEAAEARLAAYL